MEFTNRLVEILTLTLSIVTALSALISCLLSLGNRKHIKDTHKIINSRMTELLSITRTAALAEGKAEGEKSRKEDDDELA